MNIDQMFERRYLAGEDLKGQSFKLTIRCVKQEEMYDKKERKKKFGYVLYFEKAEKGLVLNVTNANIIADITGSKETTEWNGKEIMIYPEKVQAFGKQWTAIRVKDPRKAISEEQI